MADEEDANYKCILTEDSLKKAKQELFEDPKQRLGAVQTLRKWIREQPHYTCRTDTKFLLAILRRAKFSQLVARELIDNILTVRTKHPEYMVNIDIQDPGILAYIETGAMLYLPKKDKEGRTIFLIRIGMEKLDDPRFTVYNELRAVLGLGDLYRDEDENISVNGLLIVFDYTGAGMKYINYSTLEQRKIVTRIFQDCNPERVKGFLFYNFGPLIEIMMGIVKVVFKKKNQERIQIHDTMESMYKVIPMELWPDEYLPDDYKGPSAGSIASIIAENKKRLMNPDTRKRILAYTSDKYKVVESKRPSARIPNESFRKLNID